jgi:response regulator of citrate/malate metabolism
MWNLSLKDTTDFNVFAVVGSYNVTVVAFSNTKDKVHCLPSLNIGIQDCLVKGDITPQWLYQLLEHAIAKQRQRQNQFFSQRQSDQLSERKNFTEIILQDRGLTFDVNDTLARMIANAVTNLASNNT